uniref:Uncharacterized protein n=1 Tax=Rhizophora mucronata TaxID=61149 RepID=A0A2P2IIY0_RHIMU
MWEWKRNQRRKRWRRRCSCFLSLNERGFLCLLLSPSLSVSFLFYIFLGYSAPLN